MELVEQLIRAPWRALNVPQDFLHANKMNDCGIDGGINETMDWKSL